MNKFRPAKDRIFIYITSLYLVGLIFGLFIFPDQKYTPETGKNFLEVFTTNYWYIFLIWILGFSLTGLLFTSLIIFFRGFLFGALLTLFFPEEIKHLLFLLLLELVLFLPAFLLVCYFSLGLSLRSLTNLFSYQNLNFKIYLNIILITTIIIIIYSIIIVTYQV